MAILLSVKDAAKLLSVSVSYVRKLVKSGEIPAVKLGPKCLRIAVKDLEAWAESRKTMQGHQAAR